MNRTLFFVLAALFVTTGCATSADPSSEEETEETAVAESELVRRGVAVDGDDCTVRTGPDGKPIPGTEKDGNCCATSDPNDCTIILKPMPKQFFAW